ncbi:TPA: hypothetical protein DCL30_01310 [Candidatus Peribacteria bacterium]|nr:MAG: hypothetical protein A3J91_01325 [Candidatus Peribacteria bacterium RIFOXYC2_FULL_58_10]HAI98165.1 hypothetical protein [Candidatus Peribacteria bacterium]HAS34554.1 hypothetical protein [Candidatus Peribacteria bacterium]
MVTLHRFSAVLFYLLGISFFAAYLLMHNGIVPLEAAWWLQRADLPLLGSALLYGGVSFYLSVRPRGAPSRVLALLITLFLLGLFAFLVLLNFWEALPLPQGQPMM